MAPQGFIVLLLAASSMANLSAHMRGRRLSSGRARAVPATCTDAGLFCSDCQMSYFCQAAGATPLELPCDAEQVCGGTAPAAGCRNFVGESAGDCDCDTVGNSGFLADPYDPSLYFICIPPEGQIQVACADGEVFSSDDNGCIMEPTTAPPTTDGSGGSGGSAIVQSDSDVDCTQETPGFYTNDPTCQTYTVCYVVNLPGLLLSCADGEAFDTSSFQCVPECDLAPSTFSCEAAASGAFPDTIDCTIFHVCSNGQQVTPSTGISCGDGLVFEPTSMLCVAFSSDVECPEINPCWEAYCDSCGGTCPVTLTTAGDSSPSTTLGEPTATIIDTTPAESSTTTTTTPEITSTTTVPTTEPPTTEPPTTTPEPTTTPTTTSSTTTTTTTTPKITTPEADVDTTTSANTGAPDCNNSPGYYEEASDCKLFWSCQDDDAGGYEAIQYRCPGSLVYIPSLSYCSFQSDLAAAPGCIAS